MGKFRSPSCGPFFGHPKAGYFFWQESDHKRLKTPSRGSATSKPVDKACCRPPARHPNTSYRRRPRGNTHPQSVCMRVSGSNARILIHCSRSLTNAVQLEPPAASPSNAKLRGASATCKQTRWLPVSKDVSKNNASLAICAAYQPGIGGGLKTGPR